MAPPTSTPGVPSVPNSTPSSTRFSRASVRAPIYNPYDKFTQPEFDSWIGDITGALKRALGYEAPEPVVEPKRVETTAGDTSNYDEGVEDSFAEVMARRKAKGKERATEPYEDVESTKAQPIVLSSDEDEDEDVAQDVWSDGWEEEVDEGGLDTAGAHSDDEDGLVASGDTKNLEQAIELSSDEEENNGIALEDEEYDSGGEAEGARVVPESGVRFERQSPPHIVRPVDSRSTVNHTHDEGDQSDEEGSRDEISVVSNEEDFPPKRDRSQPPDLSDPWAGPSTYAEDFYSGGDAQSGLLQDANPHLLPAEAAAVQIHEVIDDEDYDDFPPPAEAQPADIADPWSGPRMFAEDYYSGGEVRGDPSFLSPSHLTPLVATPRHEDDVGLVITPGVLTTEPDVETPTNEVRQLGTEDSNSLSPRGTPEPPATQHRPSRPDPGSLYAELSPSSPISASQERGRDRNEFDVSNLMKPISPSPNFRTPHDPSSSPRASLTGHVDWNWPPAFVAGRPATRTGHLATPGGEVFDVSDYGDDDVDGPIPLDLPSYSVEDDISAEGERERSPLEVPALTNESLSTASARTTAPQVVEVASGDDLQVDPSLQHEVNLYTDLDAIYGGAEEQQNTSYEPVSDDIDFGDLPVPPSDSKRTIPSQDEHGTLASLEDVIDSSVIASPEPETHSPDFTVPSDAARAADPEVPKAPSQLEDDTIEEEIHGTFSMPSDALIEQSYTVIEVEEEVEVLAPETNDIFSYAGDSPAVVLDYIIEEPITEGRRTEEPEGRGTQSPKSGPHTVFEIETHIEVQQSPKMPDALSAIREITSHNAKLEHVAPGDDSEEDRPPNRRYTPSQRVSQLRSKMSSRSKTTEESRERDVESPLPETTSKELLEASRPVQHEIFVRASSEDSIASSSASVPAVVVSGPAVEHEDQHPDAPPSSQAPRMLESGVPMPVSADPMVPDPASRKPSPVPQSPTSSDAPIVRDSTPGSEQQASQSLRPSTKSISEGLPPSLLRHIKDRSISGLFTPMSDGGISSGSSAAHDEVTASGQANESPEGGSPEAPGLSLLISGNEIELDVAQESEKKDEGRPDSIPKVDTSTETLQSATALTPVSDERIHPQLDATIAAPESSQMVATQQSASQSETLPSIPHTQDEHDAHDADVDAEGELDPDYHHEARREASKAESKGHGDSAPAETIPPGVAEDPQIAATPLIGASPDEVQQPKTPIDDTELPNAPSNVGAEGSGEIKPPIDSFPASNPPDEPAEPVEEPRPLKRKRASPPPTPKRSARLTSLRRQKAIPKTQKVAAASQRKGKGKEKAVPEESSDDEDKEVKSMLSTQGSESISTAQLRDSSKARGTSSQPTSRSSSVVSSVHELFVPTPPVPLMHAHGALRHNHQKPELSQPIQRQGSSRGNSQPIRRQESLPNPPKAKTRSPSAVPQPASQPAPRVSASSTPVTRSNCRFHKISLPLVEDGPHVFFVVPGCSLSKTELLKEEEIEDHGVLDVEDNSRLVPDVEGLELSLYLVAVLRQLVGSDHLRENEVYYLPQPGENIRRRPKRKTKPRPSAYRESEGDRNVLSSPRRPPAPKPSPVKAPSSKATSISTASASRSVASKPKGVSTGLSSSSLSDSGLSELDDSEDEIPLKRPRTDDPVASTSQDAPPPSPPPSPTTSKKSTIRRSRRLGVDALAYKPDEQHSGSSSEDEQTKGSTRKRTRKQGTKRARERDEASGDEANDGDTETAAPKKRKMRVASSGSAVTKSSS